LASPAEDFAKVRRLSRDVIGLPAQFAEPKTEKKESDAMLAALFPIGSSFEDIFRKVRAIRKAHRDCTEYSLGFDSPTLSLSVYVYYEDADMFGKESIDFLFTFDQKKALKSVTYGQSSFEL
jgi:hypothetical protein